MKPTFDAVAWETWRKSETEKHGNDPSAWVRTSNSLVVSGALVASTYVEASKIMFRNVLKGGSATDMHRTTAEDALVSVGLQTHSVGLMLFGFAVECLMKAVFLTRGGVLYIDGRLQNPRRQGRSHNLLEVAEAVGCSSLFTPEQLEMLDLLSARNETGRYPMHSRSDSYGAQPPKPHGSGRFYGVWDSSQSATLHEALQVLYRELKAEMPRSADTLIEQGRVERHAYGLD